MYLKLSLVDELFIVKNFSLGGVEIDLPNDLVIKLYNKHNSTYNQIAEINQTSQVKRTLLSDPSVVYASTYIDGKLKKSFIKVRVTNSEVRQSYHINYTSSFSNSLTSNTFLKRYTLSMPAWSSAYKNDISQYSKLVAPLYLLTEKIYYKTNEVLWNNLKGIRNNIKRFESKSSVMSLKRLSDSSFVASSYIKQKEAINKIAETKLPLRKVFLFEEDLLDLDLPITLGNSFNNIFLQADKEAVIFLKGLDHRGNLISESVYIDDVAHVTSLLKYKKLLSVASTTQDISIKVSNHLPCDETGNTFRTKYEVSGTVSKTKSLETPKYLFNTESLTLNSYHRENTIQTGDFEDSYRVPLLRDASKYFVTTTDDIVSLINGQLFTGLLRKNIETDMPLYASNNNNSLVSLLTNDAHIDNVVEFQIRTKDILTEFGKVSVQIRLRSDYGTLYLDDDNDWVKEPCYKFLTNSNPIYVELDTTGYGYVSVELDLGATTYQASIRKDNIELTSHDFYYDDILHDGDELIGIRGNEYFNISLEKDYFEIVGASKFTYSEYHPNDYKITNLKGNK